MNAGEFLQALRTLPVTSVDALTESAPFVVLSPHPDDESLGAGGLIAGATAAGIAAHVIVLTDGSGSHPHSRRYSPKKLAALRREECRDAAVCLGLSPDRVTHLDLVDTKAPQDGPLFAGTVDRLAARVRAAQARSLFVTWGRDPHCDHEAAEAIARAVADAIPGLKLWAYPIWGWHLPSTHALPDPPPRGFRIDISPWHEAKRRAIAAHVSQMTDLIDDDPEGFRFDEAGLAPFRGFHEYFFALNS